MTAEIAPTRKQNHVWLDTAPCQRGDGNGLQHDRACEYIVEQRGGERALESLAGAERSR
jgi:hypothetical protein